MANPAAPVDPLLQPPAANPALPAQPPQPAIDAAQAIVQLAQAMQANQAQNTQILQALAAGQAGQANQHQQALQAGTQQHTALLQNIVTAQQNQAAKRFVIPGTPRLAQHKTIPQIESMRRELTIFKEKFDAIQKGNWVGRHRDKSLAALKAEQLLWTRFLNNENPAGIRRYASTEHVPYRDPNVGPEQVPHVFQIRMPEFLTAFELSKTQTRTFLNDPNNCWSDFDGNKQADLLSDFKKFNDQVMNDFYKLIGEISEISKKCHETAGVPFELKFPLPPALPKPPRIITMCSLIGNGLLVPLMTPYAALLQLGDTLQYAFNNPKKAIIGALALTAGVSTSVSVATQVAAKMMPEAIPGPIVEPRIVALAYSAKSGIAALADSAKSGIVNLANELPKMAAAYKDSPSITNIAPIVSSASIGILSLMLTHAAYKVNKCLGALTLAAGTVASALPIAIPLAMQPGALPEAIRTLTSTAASVGMDAAQLAADNVLSTTAVTAGVAGAVALKYNRPNTAAALFTTAGLLGKDFLITGAISGTKAIAHAVTEYPLLTTAAVTTGALVAGYRKYKNVPEAQRAAARQAIGNGLGRGRDGCGRLLTAAWQRTPTRERVQGLTTTALTGRYTPHVAGAVAVAGGMGLASVASMPLFVGGSLLLLGRAAAWCVNKARR